MAKPTSPTRLLACVGFLVALATVVEGCTTAWYSAWRRQKDAADALRPEATSETPSYVAALNPIKIRFYVDDDYRSQTINWSSYLGRVIRRANDSVRHLGIEFEALSMRPWHRRTSPSLAADLRDLEKQDAGNGADLIVGMVGSVPRFSASFHQLGYARILGNHFILRAMDDKAEFDALANSFSMISKKETTEIYYQRKRHKEASVLVHEWGHTLGAIHESHSECFMYISYNQRQSGFCSRNARIVQVALEHWLRQTASARQLWLEALLEILNEKHFGSTDNGELTDMRDMVRGYLGLRYQPEIAATSVPTPVDVASIRLVQEDSTQGCKLLGLKGVAISRKVSDAKVAEEQARDELRETASLMGGDTVEVARSERNGQVRLFGTIFECK